MALADREPDILSTAEKHAGDNSNRSYKLQYLPCLPLSHLYFVPLFASSPTAFLHLLRHLCLQEQSLLQPDQQVQLKLKN